MVSNSILQSHRSLTEVIDEESEVIDAQSQRGLSSFNPLCMFGDSLFIILDFPRYPNFPQTTGGLWTLVERNQWISMFIT